MENSALMCLKTVDDCSGNLITKQLIFDFVQVTVSPTTQIIQNEILKNAVVLYENMCDDTCQRFAYISINTSSTTPAYNPTLQYALKITAKTPDIFNEIVKIFNIYLLNTALVSGTFIANFINNCIYFTFPIDYKFNEQMVIIGFVDNATSANYILGLPPSTTIATVSLVSQIFFDPQDTYTTDIISTSATTLKSKFYDYTNAVSYIDLEYIKMKEYLNCNYSICVANDMCKIAKLVKFSNNKCNIYRRCRKPKCNDTLFSPTMHFKKYFCFIYSTLNCILENDNCISKCKRFEELYEHTDDSVAVYITTIAKICIDAISEFILCINDIFNDVIGYNSFTSFSNYTKIFQLNDKDCQCVNIICNNNEYDSEIKNSSSSIEFDDSTSDENNLVKANLKQGVLKKYGVYIVVVTVIVVVADLTAYAFIL